MRVLLYQYREQNGLAADMAKRAMDRDVDNRMGSGGVLRRAYISNLVRQGDINQALDFFQEQLPGAFTTPLDLPEKSNRRFAANLVEIAILINQQQPGAERATELLNIAEQKILSADPRFIPWERALDRAMIAAARHDKDTAFDALQNAIDSGLRDRWRNLLFSNIAFNSLHDEPEFKQLVSQIEADMQQQREEAYQIPGILR
jgi:hypothetical protein